MAREERPSREHIPMSLGQYAFLITLGVVAITISSMVF